MSEQQPLPAHVHDKLLALRDAETQAQTLVTMTQRAITELNSIQGNNPSGEKAISAGRELARLNGLQPDNQARHRALANLNAKATRFLSMLPANAKIEGSRIKPKLKDGETHLKAVQRLRSEIMTLIGEQGRVERSVPTNKEAKTAAKDFVQALSTRYEPSLVIEHDRFNLQFGRGVIGERDPTPTEVLAWIDPDLVLTRLEEMIDDRDPSAGQMSAADRKKRLAEIKVDLLDLERREVAHIDAAKEEGMTIEHRVNVDPRALLGLVIVGEQKG